MRSVPSAFADALLPRYRLDAVLAEGGQAVVVQARDLSLERDVALKLLPRDFATAAGIERFRREIRLLVELSHPYIIAIHDAGEVAGVLWYAMPLVRGETLAVRVAAGPVPMALARRWGRELAEALAVAHAHGVVHRDVKPSNVHLVDGHALLADFGVASLRAASDTLTGTDEAVGTRQYMAPEQRSGCGDARVDVYGLGATLVEATSGVPWTPEHPDWRRVPRAMRAPLRRAVAPRPESRWATAGAFASALAAGPVRQARRAALVFGTAAAVGASAWILRPLPAVGKFVVDLELVAATSDDLTARLLHASVVRLEWFPPLHVAPWQSTGRAAVNPNWHAEGVVEWSLGTPQLTLTLRDPAGRAIDVLHVSGDTADLPGWGASVAAAIVSRIAPDRLHDFQVQRGGARVGAALHAYYAGRGAFERQSWAEAERGFREALLLDPDFVQARWGVVQARKWARLPFADELGELARSPDLHEPLGDLVRLQRESDLSRRMTGLDSLAAAWPGVPEVHLARANELFHRGTLVGRSSLEGVAALESAARTFPSLDHPVIWDHVVWGAVREGNEALARAALRQRRRKLGEDDPWGRLLRVAVEFRFRPWLGAFLGAMLPIVARGERRRVGETHRFGVMFDLPEAQIMFAHWLQRSTASAADRADALCGLAVAALMLGRPQEALAALDSAAALGENEELAMQRFEWRTLLPVFGVIEEPVEQVSTTGLPPARAAFVLGIRAGMHGDTVTALHHLGVLEDLGADALARAVVESRIREIRGDLEGAERLLELIMHDPDDITARTRGPFVRALAALGRSRLAMARGDAVAAERALWAFSNVDVRGWPVGPPQEGELDAALSVLARWQRGLLLAGMGETASGCRLMGRARELWRTAEPAFLALSVDAASRGGEAACPG